MANLELSRIKPQSWQSWSLFINHRQISMFLCALLACVFSFFIGSQGATQFMDPRSEGTVFFIFCMSGDGVTETKTLMNVKGLSWRLILGLGALPGEPNRRQWDMRLVEIGWMHIYIYDCPYLCFTDTRAMLKSDSSCRWKAFLDKPQEGCQRRMATCHSCLYPPAKTNWSFASLP